MAAYLPSLGSKIKRHFRSFPLPDGLRLIPLKLAKRVAGGAYRRWAHPYLFDFETLVPNAYSTPEDILVRCTGVTHSTVAGLRDEFDSLSKTLAKRYETRHLAYPRNYALTYASSFLLYALVRLRRPKSILETGVANGHSTYFLLHALRVNGTGRLCSVDVAADVGALLDPAERDGWSFRRLRAGRERTDFQAYVEGWGSLDLFLHDSEHTYQWQMLEYRCAWTKLSRAGLFLSDNIDQSFAFMDFCAERKLEPTLLVSPVKIFGLVDTSVDATVKRTDNPPGSLFAATAVRPGTALQRRAGQRNPHAPAGKGESSLRRARSSNVQKPNVPSAKRMNE